MRVKFRKGKQREFINKVISKIYSPSLRALRQYGININYSSMKSYYLEHRTMPLELFESLCRLSGIDKKELDISFLDDNYGQIKGGKK